MLLLVVPLLLKLLFLSYSGLSVSPFLFPLLLLMLLLLLLLRMLRLLLVPLFYTTLIIVVIIPFAFFITIKVRKFTSVTTSGSLVLKASLTTHYS